MWFVGSYFSDQRSDLGPLQSLNLWTAREFPNLTYFKISYSWNLKLCLSLNMHLSSFLTFHSLRAYFFLVMNSIPLSEYSDEQYSIV